MTIPDPSTTAISAIGAAFKLARELVSSHADEKLKRDLGELAGLLFEAQTNSMAVKIENTALLDDKRDLEAELVRLKDWAAERERYALVRLWDYSPAVAYGLLESKSNGQPAHFLCANCFDQTKKSFLGPYAAAIGKDGRANGLACACGVKLIWPHSDLPPAAEYAPG